MYPAADGVRCGSTSVIYGDGVDLDADIARCEASADVLNLCLLKRQRRSRNAALASAGIRQAAVLSRDKDIRRAYDRAGRRHGTIAELADTYNLSRRQIARVLHPDAGSPRMAAPKRPLPDLPRPPAHSLIEIDSLKTEHAGKASEEAVVI